MKILIVDDDRDQNQLIIDAIDTYNLDNNSSITYEEVLTKDEALEKLKSSNYDAAFIDLRLSQNDIQGEGNEIIKEIYENLKIPIRVISGNPELLNEEYVAKDTILFQSKTRGEFDYKDLIKDFEDIFKTGIINILNNKGKIQENISKIFWNHLSTVLPELIKYKEDNNSVDLEKILLRYTSLHLLEYLELSVDNNLEPVHNIEFYIKPPIKDKIFTGDIVKKLDENKYGIVLTPACDLACDDKRPAKAEFVTLAVIEDLEIIEAGKNNGDIKKLKSNSYNLKYHYLPKSILFTGGYINFQNLRSVPLDDLYKSEKFELECVITNPFRKDIISRFSNYFARQGQPVFF